MIKAVIYDLDDTLFPEEQFQKSGRHFIARYLSDKGFQISEEEIERVSYENPKNAFDELIRIHHLPMEAAELIALFRNHAPALTPYPGITEVLETLSKDHALGIITDHFAQTQKNKVEALGIKKYFAQIIYTDEMGTMKPDTAPFEKMKELLGCKSGEILYVGDNEKKDFIGARAAGYITVKYKSGGVYKDFEGSPEQKADFEISEHGDILQILTLNK